MEMPIIVSYYTLPYKKDADRLIESLPSCHIKKIDSKGSWYNNANYKPVFIRESLNTYKQPVLWLDADSEVVGDISYFKTLTGDIGAHYKDGTELLSSVVWFNYNKNVFELLNKWEEENNKNPKDFYGDQKNLQRVLGRGNWEVTNIPAKYAKIFDLMKDVEDGRIIEYQSSRKHKEAV